MYLHHQESVEKLLEYFRPDPDVTAIILGGSVAKGLERSDSDIDAIVVVTPEKLQQLQAEGRRTECIFGYCTYPEGYFDIKYCDREFLEAAAQSVIIPMQAHCESLNAAIAAAIVMWQMKNGEYGG